MTLAGGHLGANDGPNICVNYLHKLFAFALINTVSHCLLMLSLHCRPG